MAALSCRLPLCMFFSIRTVGQVELTRVLQLMNWVITIYCPCTPARRNLRGRVADPSLDWIYISYLLVANFGKWL